MHSRVDFTGLLLGRFNKFEFKVFLPTTIVLGNCGLPQDRGCKGWLRYGLVAGSGHDFGFLRDGLLTALLSGAGECPLFLQIEALYPIPDDGVINDIPGYLQHTINIM